MKKFFLLGFLILTVACQYAVTTLEPVPTLTATAPPPPKLVSPTPAVIPTKTLSPTPSPRFFTEDFEAFPLEWSIIQTGDDALPRIKAEEGAFTFELNTPFTWTYAIYSAQNYQDVRLDVSIETRGTQLEAAGLICRYSGQNGWYEFNIYTDGTYNVLYGQWLEQNIASYTPIANDSSEYLKPGETQHELGLMCRQNALWLYINQKLFRKVDVTRFGLSEGKVGLAVSSFEDTPAGAAFEWIKVSEP